jgi:hypothetical protein
VREHAFFAGVDWAAVRDRRVPPPIQPTLDGIYLFFWLEKKEKEY